MLEKSDITIKSQPTKSSNDCTSCGPFLSFTRYIDFLLLLQFKCVSGEMRTPPWIGRGRGTSL